MDEDVQHFPPHRKHEAHSAHDEHGHEHYNPGYWAKFIFSTDHKIIGIQYGFTALCFLLFGFSLMLLMRWQIAHPAKAVHFFGWLLEKILGQPAAGGII